MSRLHIRSGAILRLNARARSRVVVALAAAVCLSVAAMAPAALRAQGIGGLIKKKAAEAVKPAEKPVAKADEPAAEGKCSVNDDSVDRFLKGLEAERADRAAFKAHLGTIKPKNDWLACRQQAQMSPEGIKAVQPMGNIPDKISQADLQKLMEKMAADVDKVIVSKCGPEPEDWNISKRQSRLEESVKAGAKAAGMDEACYALMKERAIPFCSLSQQQQQQAMNTGIKVPGFSKGMFYVYTPAEARALAPKCAAIMAALKAIDSIEVMGKNGA